MAPLHFSVRSLTPVEGPRWVALTQSLTGGAAEAALNRLVPALHAPDFDPAEFLVAEGSRGQWLGVLRARFRPGRRAEVLAPLIPDAAHIDEIGRSLLARFLAECWSRQIKQIEGVLLLDPPQGDPDRLDQLFVAMGFQDLDEQSLLKAELADWTPPSGQLPLAWRSLHDVGNLQFGQLLETIGAMPEGTAASTLLAMRQVAGAQLEPQRWRIGFHNGRPIGAVLPQSWPADPRTGALLALHVAPSAQGQGYGRALFTEGLRQLKDAWVSTYVGGVDLRSQPCQRLFAALPYQVLEVQRRYSGPPLE